MNDNEIIRIILAERIRLSAAVWTIVRDTHAVEDILQELVIKALEERGKFREPTHVLAWARTVSRHRAIDYVRVREGRARILSERVLDLLNAEMESHADEMLSARLDALRLCLEELPPKSRELVSLRYGEGLRANVVAEKLKQSAAAIYQRLSRLHQQLRRCVEHRTGTEGLTDSPTTSS